MGEENLPDSPSSGIGTYAKCRKCGKLYEVKGLDEGLCPECARKAYTKESSTKE